ncbi:HAD-superfamily subfamily IB hydrolase, TIGR01490 [Cryptosporangium aurantiacum]|uniref:HAD-superfamily subfamily IB hydrolase, TIGR01490 n=2 Tax=Cryptosporangium aurantiacum TaxID=134849 RepID=A0A1M7NGD3_9ACTN|nr:HAD-superfamily subfamily IB hydrolase, TIGR01490 [Cryptosporangium aurantiacum]
MRDADEQRRNRVLLRGETYTPSMSVSASAGDERPTAGLPNVDSGSHLPADPLSPESGTTVTPAAARSAAFFDLDKTVIAKSSALAFGRPFYQGGLITRRAMLRSAYAQLMFQRAGADEAQMARIRDSVTAMITGWNVSQVRQIVAETLHELIEPTIYAEAAALIGEHRAAGRDVVIVSTSGEEVVAPIGALLGVDRVVATRMAVVDGHYTGEIEYYAAGPAKAAAIRDLAESEGYDLADCYAYSDSVSDVPMLETVGHPFAVNPDRGMRKAAAERGWPTLVFRRPVTLPTRFVRPSTPVLATAAVGFGVGAAALAGMVWYGRHRGRSDSSRLSRLAQRSRAANRASAPAVSAAG